MKSPLALLLPLLATSITHADLIELKDGTKLEGTQISEDATHYTFRIQVTPTIREERRIAKIDVQRVVGESKDVTAFEPLAKFVPTPDGQDAATYREQIKATEKFLADFRISVKRKEALAILETLKTELAAIEKGGTKLNGKIVTPEDRKPNAYGFDAELAAADFNKLIAAGSPLAALRGFEKLEDQFPGSEAYRRSIPVATRTMRTLLTTVTELSSSYDRRAKERESNLAKLSPSDRQATVAALKQEEQAYLAKLEGEKKAGEKWVSLNPNVKAPIDETKRRLESEIKRLSSLNLDSLPKTEQAYRDAWTILTRGDASKEEIDAALAAARTAQVPAPYLEILEAATPAAEAKE